MTKLGNKKSCFRHVLLNNSKRNLNLTLGYITHDENRNTRYQNLYDACRALPNEIPVLNTCSNKKLKICKS